jgi:outer membrane lipoprotein-sorting protein
LIEDGIFANPSMLFSLDEKDYRYKQHSSKSVGGEAAVTEIELFPKDEKAEYRRINLRLNKATLLPVSITYYAKNSVTISIAIRKIDASVKPTAADFTFPVDKHPGVMIVDMR